MLKKEKNKKLAELYITVKADKLQWQKAQGKAIEELSKNLEVKGFRKGAVPEDVARKHLHEYQIRETAIQKIINVLASEANKYLEPKDKVIAPPSYKVEKLSDVDLEVTFVYPISPEFELKNYKGLNIEMPEKRPISEERINLDLQRIINQHTVEAKREKDEPIQMNDIVKFNFKGYVNDKPLKNAFAKNYQLVIGSGHFIKGFEEQMIGLKPGDEKTIEVKFPENYHDKKLQGQMAQFKVKVNEVKYKIVPKLTDQFVKEEVKFQKIETVSQLKKYIKEVVAKEEEFRVRELFRRKVMDIIRKNTEVPISTNLVRREMQAMQKDFLERLKNQGLTLEKYLKMNNIKLEDMNKNFYNHAAQRIKDFLIYAKIAETEKISLTDADYEKEYEKIAKLYNQPVEQIKKVLKKEQIQIPMINERVLDILIEHNKSSSTKKAPAKKAPAKKAPAKKADNDSKKKKTSK